MEKYLQIFWVFSTTGHLSGSQRWENATLTSKTNDTLSCYCGKENSHLHSKQSILSKLKSQRDFGRKSEFINRPLVRQKRTLIYAKIEKQRKWPFVLLSIKIFDLPLAINLLQSLTIFYLNFMHQKMDSQLENNIVFYLTSLSVIAFWQSLMLVLLTLIVQLKKVTYMKRKEASCVRILISPSPVPDEGAH